MTDTAAKRGRVVASAFSLAIGVAATVAGYAARHHGQRPHTGPAPSANELPMVRFLREHVADNTALFGAGAKVGDITLDEHGETVIGFQIHHNISTELAGAGRLQRIESRVDDLLSGGGRWHVAGADFIDGTVSFARFEHDEPIHGVWRSTTGQRAAPVTVIFDEYAEFTEWLRDVGEDSPGATSLLAPPLVDEVGGVDAAAAAYPTMRVALAEDAGAQLICWHPPTQPHLLISGGYRVGKTVTLQNLAAQLARAHWAVYLAACQEREYQQFRDWPNVRCVATSADDHIAVIDHLCELLRQRQWCAGAGAEFAPVVFLIDSVPELIDDIIVEKPPRRQRISDGIKHLLRLGRSWRIHVVIAGTRRDLDYAFDTVEIPLRLSPYRDDIVQSQRDLARLRPARSSYPPAEFT